MDLLAYLRVFRRRWLLIVIPAVAALAFSWATLPKVAAQTGPTFSSYTATATLIQSPDVSFSDSPFGSGLSMSTVSLFTTVGRVPEMAAKKLGYKGEPQVLATQVLTTPQTDTDTLQISSTSTDPRGVVKLVNAFSESVIAYFKDSQDASTQARIDALTKQSSATTRQIRRVQRQQGRGTDPVLAARLSALQAEYSSQFGEIQNLKQRLGGPGPLTVLQAPVAIPQVSGGFTAPSNPMARILIAVLLGTILGAALSLVVERIDSRIRTREQAEESFGLPVLAEIPALAWSQRKEREIASFTKPASPTAEAFRALRSSLLLLGNMGGTHPDDRQDRHAASVIMVTSSLAGEGKTTAVANLAAVMAEAGRSVVALSLDLRSPRLHEYFGVENGTGISDLLAADRGDHLDQILRETSISGVRIATSGQQLTHPGALLAAAGPMFERARQLADVVIVDSAPMLTVSDAVDLAPLVDMAVVVARLNGTTTGQAASTQRLLSRLKVPALGSVLVGSRPNVGHEYRVGPVAVKAPSLGADRPEPTENTQERVTEPNEGA